MRAAVPFSVDSQLLLHILVIKLILFIREVIAKRRHLALFCHVLEVDASQLNRCYLRNVAQSESRDAGDLAQARVCTAFDQT